MSIPCCQVNAMSDAPPAERSARLFSYDDKELDKSEVAIEEAMNAIGRRKVAWISISGKADHTLLETIGGRAGVDPYELASVVEFSRGRARVEDLGSAVFVIWSTPRKMDGDMEEHPAYFLLGPDYLISVQDEDDHYEEVIERLGNERSRLRRSGPGFLLYAILSSITEEFFDRVEDLSDAISRLEDSIMDRSGRSALSEIGHMRDRVASMWKAVRPLREAAGALSERQNSVVRAGERMYFAELLSILDLLLHEVDSLNQIVPQLIDLYENNTSRQLNQIVKVLTVFSVVFTPLTLIAAIYGMNFEHMPELEHDLGYPLALMLMFLVSASMLLYFYRKGWLSSEEKRD